VVIRSAPPADGLPVSLATLRRRTPARLDVIGWRQGRATPPQRNALVLGVPDTLPSGLRDTLAEVLGQVDAAGGPPPGDALRAIANTAKGSFPTTPLYVFLAVAHPAEPSLLHFACGQIPPSAADRIRTGQVRSGGDFARIPIEWLPMSDERPEITTRRDSTRPVAAFAGKSVEVWGCGGLGSWLAEFIVRAGAEMIVLRDNRRVNGGLLARQNYREDDVGKAKATQLAERLAAIADGIRVVPHVESVLDLLRSGAVPDCDLIIDATINESVAVRLDEAARAATIRPTLAQVATDPRTASLGLLVVAGRTSGVGPSTIDNATADVVRANGQLERFHGFWTPASKSDQLVPAAGCSVPTFHGSAADLAVVAGAMASFIGQHLNSGTSGTHLMASPVGNAEVVPHKFIPFPLTATTAAVENR
jgi:molybdopterin/thiamine biosynthesis adenylyltransferase